MRVFRRNFPVAVSCNLASRSPLQGPFTAGDVGSCGPAGSGRTGPSSTKQGAVAHSGSGNVLRSFGLRQSLALCVVQKTWKATLSQGRGRFGSFWKGFPATREDVTYSEVSHTHANSMLHRFLDHLLS